MIKQGLFFLFLLLVQFSHASQQRDSLTLAKDTVQQLTLRSYEENLSQKYVGNDFNYELKDGESQNLLARFINWILRGLVDTFGIHIPPNIALIMEYFIYILMGALALYLLLKFLIGENMASLFTKKAKAILDLKLEENHIETLDLEALINQALTQKDYRLAVRYQFLKALKILSQNQLIEWHYEKTNWDYQKEIKRPKLNKIFKEISYLYDYIWYGEQVIDEIKYNTTALQFSALQKHIQNLDG